MSGSATIFWAIRYSRHPIYTSYTWFYKSIHISYPDKQERSRARKSGVDPGDHIMIHGQKNGLEWATFVVQLFSWTDGCVALSNGNMDKVWKAVDPGTPIEIRP